MAVIMVIFNLPTVFEIAIMCMLIHHVNYDHVPKCEFCLLSYIKKFSVLIRELENLTL